jgi:hypothetical protein
LKSGRRCAMTDSWRALFPVPRPVRFIFDAGAHRLLIPLEALLTGVDSMRNPAWA